MLGHALKKLLADKANDMKAENIVTVDTIGKSSITDYMIICTANSKRHASSIAEKIAVEARNVGLAPCVSGESEGEWVVLDVGDVMVHVMQQEQREQYQLEKLWS